MAGIWNQAEIKILSAVDTQKLSTFLYLHIVQGVKDILVTHKHTHKEWIYKPITFVVLQIKYYTHIAVTLILIYLQACKKYILIKK